MVACFAETPSCPTAVPWHTAGRNAFECKRLPSERIGRMVMKPGSDSFSEPNPYTTQEPTEGRTKFAEPVCRQREALEWLAESVCIERMKQRSSACWVRKGSTSLISSPLWPCFSNLKGEPLMTRLRF